MSPRRLIRDLSSVLIISGLLLVLDAGVTLAWQEPVTALVAVLRRSEVDHRFQRIPLTGLSALQRQDLSLLRSEQSRLGFLARQMFRHLRTGDAIGHIRIPAIGVSFDVVEGDDHLSLEKGPGHYPQTAVPGMGETVAIAGHRTTYLAPFRHIAALRRGDRIIMEMPYGRFTYLVQGTRIVAPTAVWVTDDVGYDRLVLSACNPLYSAAQRIIVFARLQRAAAATGQSSARR